MVAEGENEPPMRRVRPWVAALLTFVGPGLGFYYARQPRAAAFWAIASVILSIVLAGAALAYLLTASEISSDLVTCIANIAGWVVATIVAIVAWIMAARTPEVKRSSPARLFGYLAVWALPFLLSLILAFGIRSLYAQPFRIPSATMEPTLHVGDYILVSKSAYGYGPYTTAPLVGLMARDPNETRAPERGDIVVFRPVPEPDRDFVKRVVGLPGDRIQMIDGVLHINGAAVQLQELGEVEASYGGMPGRAHAFRETLPNGVSYTVLDVGETELDNTREYVVPPNQYFMMGDHRDNSADSRVFVGFVPIENIVGRVEHIVRGSESRRSN